FFYQAEDGIRDRNVTGVQTCALPICGQIDIGLAVMDGAYEAYEGSGKWEDDPQKNLRTLYVYTENALYYVVTQDSGIAEFSDFRSEERRVGRERRSHIL